MTRTTSVVLLLVLSALFCAEATAQSLWLAGRTSDSSTCIIAKDRSISTSFSAFGVSSDPLAPKTQAVIGTGLTQPAGTFNSGGVAVNRPWNVYWVTDGIPAGSPLAYSFTSAPIPTKLCGALPFAGPQTATKPPAMGPSPNIAGIAHDPQFAFVSDPNGDPTAHPGRIWCLFFPTFRGSEIHFVLSCVRGPISPDRAAG